MSRRNLIIFVSILLLILGFVGFLLIRQTDSFSEDDLSPGVIREDTLDIKTGNPQPAGRNTPVN